MRQNLLIIVALAGALAGCAGPVRVQSGASGPALPARSAISLIGATRSDNSPDDNRLAVKAQADVVAALAARGHAVADVALARLEVGLTDRLASTGFGVQDGPDLSPGKKKGFLQSCKRRTYRLVITYYGAGADVPVTRAWAEEEHCKADLESSIARLADKAVAALALGSASKASISPASKQVPSPQPSSARGSMREKVAP